MMVGRRTFLGAAGAAIATSAAAQQWGDPPLRSDRDPEAPAAWPASERFPLWPGKPPGAPAALIKPDWTMNGPRGQRQLWVRGVPFPEVHVFRPDKPDGSSVLVTPGGGYGFLSVQNEGLDIAAFLNNRATTVFVLTYRLPGEGWSDRHLVPLQDAQRAMRLIRSRAVDFAIDPRRLGVLGFSAGGHLAADLATAYSQRVYPTVDGADQLPARPAFAGLIYPVTGLRLRTTHSGSLGNLLGPSPSEALVDARSPVLHIGKDAPPSFLVHATDDGTVPLSNSLQWLEGCRSAGVPCEAHIYAEGGHGFGLRLAKDMPASRWGELFSLWMRKHGG